jgi:hypothetical protein
MRKVFLALGLLACWSASADVYLGEFGVAKTFDFTLFNTDGTLDTDEADAGTEVTLYCNDGNGVTATNDFVDEGTFYSITLTAAEMQCARLAVSVGATDLNVFFIDTLAAPLAALAAYDPPTNAEMEARTPTAAQLAQLIADACLIRSATVNESDFDDVTGTEIELYNRAGNTVVITTTMSGTNMADRSTVVVGACN